MFSLIGSREATREWFLRVCAPPLACDANGRRFLPEQSGEECAAAAVLQAAPAPRESCGVRAGLPPCFKYESHASALVRGGPLF